MAALHQSSGMHLIADLHGIAAERLTDADAIEQLLARSALAAGATIVYSHFHRFGPGQGVTGVLLLAESHISVHTWPECGFAALDIFMCGEAHPQAALDLIIATLLPTSTDIRRIARGSMHHATPVAA